MPTNIQILTQYWGYATFRSLQEEVIDTVIAGTDTLAIMPTGGGKSICFQVPAMASEGLCIVISPLIALMKDQVEQLNRRGISAIAIYSGMSNREIDIAIDRCAYDPMMKFLYLSPERLATEIFQARLPKLPVNLIAVDEAHCISQWGFDFRPAYLNIAQLRIALPKVTFIALTASATEAVIQDICRILVFKKYQIFKKSFFRNNLSYSCFVEPEKEARLLKILTRVSGSAIVYVRTRLHTKQTAAFLQSKGISAGYYHGGLPHLERSKTQSEWLQNRTRVMVATNAFGMGIDKADVRLVIHLDMPSTPEAYYQEAGRAGRDEQKAYAILLYQPEEVAEMRYAIESNYPSQAAIQKVYQMIANYLKVAVGGSQFASYDFDIEHFCTIYKLKQKETFVVLKILEKENLLHINQDFYAPSKIFIKTTSTELYEYQVKYPTHDKIIKTILRMYGGEIFSEYVPISEISIAKNLKLDTKALVSHLQNLADNGILYYEAQKLLPQLTFLTPRKDATNLGINLQLLQQLKERDLERLAAIETYIENNNQCRSYSLCLYFDNKIKDLIECGICDVCIEKKKKAQKNWAAENKSKIFNIIAINKFSTEQILQLFPTSDEKSVIATMRFLRDEGLIVLEKSNSVWKVSDE